MFDDVKTFFKRLWMKFLRDQGFEKAAGLSFTGLLALVPLSALFFSLLSAFGTFEGIINNIEHILVKQLLPASQEVIMTYIHRFVDNTRAMGVVGLVVFLITAVFLMNTVQGIFNDIWGSTAKRFSLRRFATYVSILIVGSFLISIGLNLFDMVRTLVDVTKLKFIGRISFLFLETVSLSILFLAFLLMIYLLPGDRVSFKSAVIGALFGTVSWEIARNIFFFWTRYVIRLSVIYGSLAAIPILLFWLYVAWVVVLLSLEVAYVHQHWKTPYFLESMRETDPAKRLLVGLDVYLYIARNFHRGDKPVTLSEISNRLHISVSDVSFFADIFFKNNLLLFTGKDNRGLIPSRSLEKIKIIDIVHSLFGSMGDAAVAIAGNAVISIYKKVELAMENTLGNLSVPDVLTMEERYMREPYLHENNGNFNIKKVMKTLLSRIKKGEK